MSYPIGIRRLTVLRTQRLGPAIVRVTLGGPGLDRFLSFCPTEHVRLVFPDEDGTRRLPEPNGQMLRWPRPMPRSREYTVRRFNPDAGELDVDLVLHDGGLAAGWAEAVTAGEQIDVAGPPGGLAVPEPRPRVTIRPAATLRVCRTNVRDVAGSVLDPRLLAGRSTPRWHHERTLTPAAGGGTLVTDRITLGPRGPLVRAGRSCARCLAPSSTTGTAGSSGTSPGESDSPPVPLSGGLNGRLAR